MIIRHSGIVEELDLAAHGLRYIDCDPWGFAPAPSPGDAGPDGRPLVFSVDLDATCASIAAACGPDDAAAYRRFVAVWGPRSRAVVASFGRRPTPAGLVRSFWPLGAPADGRPRTPGGDLAVDFLGSGDALLDRWFGSERLKAALAWFGAQSGPPMSEPGHRGHGRLGGAAARRPARSPGRRLGRAHRRAAPAAGVRRRPGRPRGRRRPAARRGRPGHRRRDGVRTTDRDAGAVVAACHVLAHPRPGRRRTHPRRWPTPTRRSATASASSSGRSPTPCPPIRACRPSSPPQGLQLLCTDRARPRRRARRLGGRPAAPRRRCRWRCRFSASDDTLAPPGQHVVTIWGQWYPYALADGADWDALAEAEAAGSSTPSTGTPRASPTRYSGCTYRRRCSWSANCRCPVATSCTWRWAWPACSGSGRRRRSSGYTVPGLPGPLPRRRLHPPRRRGVGQLRPDGGPRAARRPASARPRAGPRCAAPSGGCVRDGGGRSSAAPPPAVRQRAAAAGARGAARPDRDRLSADVGRRRATRSAGRSSSWAPACRSSTPGLSRGARVGAGVARSWSPSPRWRSRPSGWPPASRTAATSTATPSVRPLLGVPFLVPLAWLMMAWPSWVLADRLTRRVRAVAARSSASPWRRRSSPPGTSSSTRRWCRPATGPGRTRSPGCPASPPCR